MTAGWARASASAAAQWVVARRPSSSPVAASGKVPVQMEAMRVPGGGGGGGGGGGPRRGGGGGGGGGAGGAAGGRGRRRGAPPRDDRG